MPPSLRSRRQGKDPMEHITALISGDAARWIGLAMTMLIGPGGLTDPAAIMPQQTDPPAAACTLADPELEAEPWVRTELFFGTVMPDGRAVSEAEWDAFLDAEITPRFPEGLTVLSGEGQWQGENNVIVEERSKIVILLYPREAMAESNAEIEAIRQAYETKFKQESVLRADDDRPVCTSF